MGSLDDTLLLRGVGQEGEPMKSYWSFKEEVSGSFLEHWLGTWERFNILFSMTIYHREPME